MAAKNILFIEGAVKSPNGDLRQGFAKLLGQLMKGQLPRTILGDGKTQTIDKFKNTQLEPEHRWLLVDLDAPETAMEADWATHDLIQVKENVFYMIHEMEACFLSQPDVLDQFYGKDKNGKLISEKLVKKKAIDITHPDEVLQQLTKETNRGKYHKIKHAVELLKQLSAEQLAEDFSEFKRLVDALQN